MPESMRLSDEPLLDADAIAARVAELAAAIRRDYDGTPLTCLVVLKGAAWFGADLIRLLPESTVVEFVHARSYDGAASTGNVHIETGAGPLAAGSHVLLIEDIIDTGHTLAALRARLLAHRPASLKACALLDKPARRQVDAAADYIGFEIPDHFVVGYGLDYNEHYRALPAIYQLIAR